MSSDCIYLEHNHETGAYTCNGDDVWFEECETCMVPPETSRLL
jgi:hypothetical protein